MILAGNDEIKSRIVFNTPLYKLEACALYRFSKIAFKEGMVGLALISLTMFLGTRLFGSLAIIV